MASDWEGLSIGYSDTMFDVSPTWTRIDTAVRTSGIQIERGRQDEFERTDTGSMTVTINDRAKVIDIAALDAKPIAFALRNPISDEWFPLFRGVVDEVKSEYDKSTLVNRITITAVDALDYFAGVQMIVGTSGFVNGTANKQG